MNSLTTSFFDDESSETTITNIAADVLNTETENLSFAQVSQFTDEDVYNHLHPSPGP